MARVRCRLLPRSRGAKLLLSPSSRTVSNPFRLSPRPSHVAYIPAGSPAFPTQLSYKQTPPKATCTITLTAIRNRTECEFIVGSATCLKRELGPLQKLSAGEQAVEADGGPFSETRCRPG